MVISPGFLRPGPRAATRSHAQGMEVVLGQTSTQLSGYVDFPSSAQVARIERITKRTKSGKTRTEVVYLITSLSPEKASENRVHWVRDVAFAEDLSQIRTGAGPRVMATLRNLAISLIRLRDKTRGIAEALRDLAARPHLTLAMVGL